MKTATPRNPIAAQIIALASSAYSDDFIGQIYDAEHDRVDMEGGDTLAAFIALEIREMSVGVEDAKQAAHSAARALQRAIDELERVVDKLAAFGTTP